MAYSKKIDTYSPYVADGRFGRASYIAWNFLISVIMLLCFASVIAIYWSSISTLFNMPEATPESAEQIMDAIAPINAFSSLINFIFLYFIFVFSIKRLHDLNKSGWLSLLNLIPIINLFFAVWLSVSVGNEGKNDFGYPRPAKNWEYTLAWISIVIMSLAGLALLVALIQVLRYF